MEPSNFLKGLTFVTLGVAGLLFGLHTFMPEAQAHWKFAIASIVLFALVCTGLFFAGANAVRSKSKAAFVNLVSSSVFGKMVMSIAFLFIYQRIVKPDNEWFVGIFLICYVVYTGFEVWFMTRLART
jgi:hypothetical protein